MKDFTKIGIIYCGFNMAESIDCTLLPWIIAREEKLAGIEWVISCVSVPFKEYKDIQITEDGTRDILKDYYNNFKIDSLITEPDYCTEAEIRNKALQLLLKSGCNLIWLVDADEFYTLDQIENIYYEVVKNPWISWFSLSLKNYVFDEKTYLACPFTPPRIFRVRTNGYHLRECYFDNDMAYLGCNGTISYKELPTKTISQNIAWIRHITWLSNKKSQQKAEYQLRHFGHSGYIWNYLTNKLEFNRDFYLKNNLSIPQIVTENT